MKKLADVFGVRQKKPLSYLVRKGVDDKFKAALETDRHILIYGSSKQGKTSLREKHLTETRMFTYPCGPKTTTEDIYQAVLRNADVKIETGESKTSETRGGGKARTGFRALFSVFGGITGDAEISAERGSKTERHTEFIDFDMGEAQAIIELLKRTSYDKLIVLENFHYLPPNVQKDLAFDLKAFHEASIRFIILGVWQEANYLVMYNSDLAGRIVEIPVEPWDDKDFDQVIANGSEILNIRMCPEARKVFKKNAFGNVGLLQSFLYSYCRLSGVEKDSPTLVNLRSRVNIDETLREVLADYHGKLLPALITIAAKSRTSTPADDPLILPFYLVQVILDTSVEELKEGISKQRLLGMIQAIHHRPDKETIRPRDIERLLKNLPAYQEGVRPHLVSYDPNDQRLKIVDATQFFVLANSDRNKLKQEIQNPRVNDS